MSHYVVYHNPDKRGFSASDCNGFSVLTDKPATNVEGSRIWLLTGEDTPRQYYLASTFIAQRVGSGREEGFVTCVSADAGQRFHPMIPLSAEDWFPDFRRSQANFSLGMRPISDERVIRGLCELAGISS
jgi:hypothetical protein